MRKDATMDTVFKTAEGKSRMEISLRNVEVES